MSNRHVQLLGLLLDEEEITLTELTKRTAHFYAMKNPYKALVRDLDYLIELNAVWATRRPENAGFLLSIRLDWPTKITDAEFFRRVKEMPKVQGPRILVYITAYPSGGSGAQLSSSNRSFRWFLLVVGRSSTADPVPVIRPSCSPRAKTPLPARLAPRQARGKSSPVRRCGSGFARWRRQAWPSSWE